MKVHWTYNAVEHLVNIYEHIALNSPTYAKRMVDRITRRSKQIAEHPLSGRKVPEYDMVLALFRVFVLSRFSDKFIFFGSGLSGFGFNFQFYFF